MSHAHNFKDLMGQRFFRWLVLRLGKKRGKRVYWVCQCDCGKVKEVLGSSLRRGITKSCICLNKEINSKNNSTHRLTKTPLYKVWSGIKRRCYNQNEEKYPMYGGQGITVCDEWRNDPVAFIQWGQAHGYKHGLTLDRFPNQKGNYSPDNCRWATPKEQSRNTKKNVWNMWRLELQEK